MEIEIPISYETDFLALASKGYFNLNWHDEEPALTFTDLGRTVFIETVMEASNVPDDPIALQAKAEMWKERALKAEARALSAHNHDIDPSCREFTRQGVTLGECMLREFKGKE